MEALEKSSKKWETSEHDIVPWLNYFIGIMLLGAYRTFEEKAVILLQKSRSSFELIEYIVSNLPQTFTVHQIQNIYPGLSKVVIQRALAKLRNAGRVELLGRGRDALWKRKDLE